MSLAGYDKITPNLLLDYEDALLRICCITIINNDQVFTQCVYLTKLHLWVRQARETINFKFFETNELYTELKNNIIITVTTILLDQLGNFKNNKSNYIYLEASISGQIKPQII